MKFRLLSLFIILALSCDEIGSDITHPLSSSKKYLFKEGDILVYESDTQVEKFEVLKIVDGRYGDSRSGTCAKPRLDIYEYQAVYLKPVDTLSHMYYFVPPSSDDCGSYPQLRSQNLICSLNNSYLENSTDKIIWMNEFSDLISNFQNTHQSLTLRNKVYKDVFEYGFTNGKRLDKLFYTRTFGFVGYRLKDGTTFSLK
jgi:hypothetical protein